MKLKILYACLYIVGFFLCIFLLPILYFLSLFIKVKIGSVAVGRLGHLSLDFESFLRKKQIEEPSSKTHYIFIVGRTSNRQLLDMWKRHLFIIENRILFGIWLHSTWIWSKTKFYQSYWHKPNQYEEYQKGKPTLTFTREEEEKGKNILKQMGTDLEKDWFVCIFARDSAYLKTIMPQNDWSYHNYRNANINTFRKGVDYLVEQGAYILRVGQNVERPIDFAGSRVIDYAIRSRSDFMDIYLPAKCTFFMGSLSGISDVAMIFDRPRLGLNVVPLGAPPWGKKSLFIPKKIKNRKTGDYVPFAEVLTRTKDINHPALWMVEEFAKLGYEYEDNTEDEILEVTQEMVERIRGTFTQTEEDRFLQDLYFKSFPEDHWGRETRTPIGRDFLKKYQFLLTK